ncbi:MAG: heavy metal-associated domain-containing protein, partial [Clostridia bacterium]|nr:heavy metal-associated domain-containing protein [Clostridia bacterium]
MKNTLNITGMTCASCANTVERRVGKLEGVQTANVNLATEKLVVEFDENLTNLQNIKDTIKKA